MQIRDGTTVIKIESTLVVVSYEFDPFIQTRFHLRSESF